MTTTVVIATVNRPTEVRAVLSDWRRGSVLPTDVRVVDASDDGATQQVCESPWDPLPVTYIRSPYKSAARQRNLGAEDCHTDLIVFCDDDVQLPPDTLERLLLVFVQDVEKRIGGISGTIVGLHHPVPRGLLRWYYRLQAGYDHAHFGGQFFGAAINTLPTDRPEDPVLYPSHWLNTTLVAYRRELFQRERFPEFAGYSFQEDVNLSARVGRTHALYFHRGIRYVHNALPGQHKADQHGLAVMRMAHRWHNATTLLGLRGIRRWWKFFATVAFESIVLLRNRPTGWRRRWCGIWSAWWRLAVLRRDPRTVIGSEFR